MQNLLGCARNKGFTMLSVLVGLAVLGIASVIVAQSLLSLNKATNSVSTRSELDLINANINNIISSNRSCYHSFRDDKGALLKIDGTYPKNISYFGMGDTPPQPLLQFEKDQPIKLNGGLVIDAFQIVIEPVADGIVHSNTPGVDYTRYLANLRLTSHLLASGNYAPGEKRIDTLQLPLLVDQTTQEIIYCGFPFAHAYDLQFTNDIIKGGNCDPGSFASSVDKDGSVHCKSYVVNCPAKSYLQGISPDGNPICQPLPEPPVWPAPPVLTRSPCSSNDFKPASCSVAIPADKSAIDTISVDQRLSKSGCVLNQSYGIGPDGQSIYVKKGCRAEFGVTFK